MQFYIMNDMLMSKSGNETLTVEAFGKNSLRIRSYIDEKIDGNCFALTGKSDFKPEITVTESSATVKNGKIICNIAKNGAVTFYNDSGKCLLTEYYRSPVGKTGHSHGLRVKAREFKPLPGNDFKITMRFEAAEGERIYGCGQYQQPFLNLKGCKLELAQRNSQITVPFYISNQGYGFLWNNPVFEKLS